MQLTGEGVWGPPDDWSEAIDLLRNAYDWGVRLFDTAWYYGPYVVHELMLDAFHPFPEDLTIVTKVGNSRGLERTWKPALTPTDLVAACEQDLRLLRLSSLPLVLLRWNPSAGDESTFTEAVETMKDLQDEGKIQSFGLSNVAPRHLDIATTIAPIAAISNAYSLSNRRDEGLVSLCDTMRIPFIAYYPLLGGSLVRNVVVQRVARELSLTPAQLGIAWLSAQSKHIVPIPGTKRRRHLRDNTEAQLLSIEDFHLRQLEAAIPQRPLG